MTANRVYFMQHGLAVDKTANPERPLSEAGIHQTKTMADILLASKVSISCVLHSGKLRASQTADIITASLGLSPASAIDGLSPNDDVTLLAQKLDINDALYVGHLPHLEKLVAYLVTGSQNNNIVRFINSAVVCLEKNDGPYLVARYITPDLFIRS